MSPKSCWSSSTEQWLRVCSFSITVWYGNTTADDRKRLNRVVKTATKITRAKLPTFDELYRSRVLRKAHCIIRDKFHPANSLFKLMRSGNRYRSIPTRYDRAMESFIPLLFTPSMNVTSIVNSDLIRCPYTRRCN